MDRGNDIQGKVIARFHGLGDAGHVQVQANLVARPDM